jgi:hypothetical protein
MHPLHDYVAKQLASHLTARGVVVWFDPRREFAPFIDELRGGPRARGALTAVTVGPIAAQLAEYDGSMFELRALAEPLVGGDVPDKLVVYLPGIDSEPTTSVLLELELAGERYQPGLKRLARNVLAQRYTDGVIDELTNPAQHRLGRAGPGRVGHQQRRGAVDAEDDLPQGQERRRAGRRVARRRSARRGDRRQGRRASW